MILKGSYGAVDKIGINVTCREMLLVAYTMIKINETVKKAGLEVTLYLISKTPLTQAQGLEGSPNGR